MASDRARVSFDPSRHWRGVVGQQGRVTLEADWNEATAIIAEESRAQLIDVIGPSGSADRGYTVTALTSDDGRATGDLAIHAGSLYVGGQRMVLDADVTYGAQPDWLDTGGDPLWTAPGVPAGDGTEAIFLMLREQEVGATEDPALLDVALGGPDTTERLRIVQRIVRRSTAATTCADALAEAGTGATFGRRFDPQTLRLLSPSRLQVSFSQSPGAATACVPMAQGGFLGAENQMIRVQVAAVDEQGTPTLVWGFDNAHFLYRTAADPIVDAAAGTTTLTLTTAPVDSFHQPAKGQAVELLTAAARLTADDYVAAASGQVTTAAAAYQPDTQQLSIAGVLTSAQAAAPALFVRVWQDKVVYSGGAIALGDTGIEVTLSLDATTARHQVGDHWSFAVRPGTTALYPQRILDSPQPPDGPRMWACLLALMSWTGGVSSLTDCRAPYENLVDALASLTAPDISYAPGSCEVLKGATTVADALDLLCEHASQGDDFPIALLRLFGRGVICGVIPAISVSAPTAGTTDVPISIAVTDGSVIDGRGAVLTLSQLPPLQMTVPALAGGSPTEVKQWLYLVSGPGKPPQLELGGSPPAGRLDLPPDVVTALENPSGGPSVPDSDTCAQAQTDAWQMFADVPCIFTNGDAGVCLGTVGVMGEAGWVSPDDREQVFPTPAITTARWSAQRQPTYDALKSACLAGAVNVSAISLGDAGGPSLDQQALLGGTSGRTATVTLDDIVRGSALGVTLQASAGVTVHAPAAIQPGQSSMAITFDIADVSGPQSITAVIDAQRQLKVSFSAVQVQSLTLDGGRTAAMCGDIATVSAALSGPLSEPLNVILSGPISSAQIAIPAGGSSGAAAIGVPMVSGAITVNATSQLVGGVAGPPRTLVFTAVALAGILRTNGQSLDNTIIANTGGAIAAAVTLTAPAPQPLSILVGVTPVAGIPALSEAPPAVPVNQGATSSAAFNLTPIAGRTGQQTVRTTYNAMQLSARVTVTKIGKESKDVKEGKDGKELHKEISKEVDKALPKDSLDAPVHVLPQVVTPGGPGTVEPAGQAFVQQALRPPVGENAFAVQDEEDEEP